MSEKRQRLRLLQNVGRRGAKVVLPDSGQSGGASRSEEVAANSENSAQPHPNPPQGEGTRPHSRPSGLLPSGRAPQGEGARPHPCPPLGEGTEQGDEVYPWEVEAEELLSEFKPQVAAYIAWASSPAKGRKPATQAELASLLGLKDDRTIRQWRAKDKRIDQTIRERQAGPLWAHRRDIFDALVLSASTADAANFSDRKLALEMMGDYVPKSRLDTNNVTPATPFTSDEYSQAAQQLALWESQQETGEQGLETGDWRAETGDEVRRQKSERQGDSQR